MKLPRFYLSDLFWLALAAALVGVGVYLGLWIDQRNHKALIRENQELKISEKILAEENEQLQAELSRLDWEAKLRALRGK